MINFSSVSNCFNEVCIKTFSKETVGYNRNVNRNINKFDKYLISLLFQSFELEIKLC